jgi:hypothetical protein
MKVLVMLLLIAYMNRIKVTDMTEKYKDINDATNYLSFNRFITDRMQPQLKDLLISIGITEMPTWMKQGSSPSTSKSTSISQPLLLALPLPLTPDQGSSVSASTPTSIISQPLLLALPLTHEGG